jgi:hypothetical protein
MILNDPCGVCGVFGLVFWLIGWRCNPSSYVKLMDDRHEDIGFRRDAWQCARLSMRKLTNNTAL